MVVILFKSAHHRDDNKMYKPPNESRNVMNVKKIAAYSAGVFVLIGVGGALSPPDSTPVTNTPPITTTAPTYTPAASPDTSDVDNCVAETEDIADRMQDMSARAFTVDPSSSRELRSLISEARDIVADGRDLVDACGHYAPKEAAVVSDTLDSLETSTDLLESLS